MNKETALEILSYISRDLFIEKYEQRWTGNKWENCSNIYRLYKLWDQAKLVMGYK